MTTPHSNITFLRVSMSSNRFAHDSLIPSFHSAIVAASECPVPISWSHNALVFATRSVPTCVVSCAKSSNFSINNCKQENTCKIWNLYISVSLWNIIKRLTMYLIFCTDSVPDVLQLWLVSRCLLRHQGFCLSPSNAVNVVSKEMKY